MIKFDKVSKKFGEITALENISFEVEPGGFIFITGPSGAGKSTLIKLITKELNPSSGTIEIDNENTAKISKKKIPQFRRKIGVVFQDFKLLPDRTVFENVSLPLEVVGENDKEIQKKVSEVLELVGIAERKDLFPAQLAGGELQRACIARAIVGNPKILLADEPTGNLDPTTAWQIVKLIKKINKLGTTIFMATHNMDIVDSMKEQVIRLENGKLVKNEKQGKYEVS